MPLVPNREYRTPRHWPQERDHGGCYRFASDQGLNRWAPTDLCQSKESGSVGCRAMTLEDCCKEGCAFGH